jgi:hypothetical protein
MQAHGSCLFNCKSDGLRGRTESPGTLRLGVVPVPAEVELGASSKV